MDLWRAVVLGLVEGLTEFLPVSSTGHLLVTQRLLGIEASAAANAYAIAIQGGAIAAVLVLYRQRLLQMLRGVLGRDAEGLHLALALVVAFVPAAIAGLAVRRPDRRLPVRADPGGRSRGPSGGLLMLAISSRLQPGGARLGRVALSSALIIGLCQCAALWPGVSRSLATILGGVAVGLSLSAAVEFSFLLGLLTLGAATAYKALDSGGVMLAAYGPRS